MNDFWSVVTGKISKNLKKLHKITNNSMKNMDSTLILNKCGRGPPKKHPHQFAKNLCIGLKG